MHLIQLLLKAGLEGRHTTFFFADSQIKDESFMEDISMILNTGDLPNLYAADEKADIVEKLYAVAKAEVSCMMPTRFRTCECKFIYLSLFNEPIHT